MESQRDNWKGLLYDLRKEIERPLTIHEQIMEAFPSYVDTFMTSSQLKADKMFPNLRSHVDKCKKCREALEDLLEMVKAPVAEALDIEHWPVPPFMISPEPDVQRPRT